MGGMKRPPEGSEGSGRGPYVTALFYALGSVLVLFGELFSAEAESAYDSQADRDVADGAGNRAGGGVALRGLAIARLGGGDDGDGGGFGVITAGALVGIGEELVGGFVLLVTALCALFPVRGGIVLQGLTKGADLMRQLSFADSAGLVMVAIADIYPSGGGVDSLIQLLVAAFAGTHFPVFFLICGDPRTVMIVAEGGFRHGGKSCLGGGGVIGEQLITAALPVGSIAGCGAGGGLSRYGSKMTGMDMTEGGGEDFAAFGALDGGTFSCSITVGDMVRRIFYFGTASTLALVPVLVIIGRPVSSPFMAKRATIGGGAAGTLAGLRSGTGCISPIMAEGAAFCLIANRTGFGSGAVCGGPVVLCIAIFSAIGSTCCQGAAFGRTLMPVVGTIAGPLGSPLVNMGGGDGEGARIYSKIYKAIINISHRQVIIIFDSNTHFSRICGFLNFISNCYNLKIS